MRLRAIFEQEKLEAEMIWGIMDIHFIIGFAGDFPNNRDYAYCTQLDPDSCLIVVAPKMKNDSDSRVLGVLRHEIGHAIDFLIPKELIESKLLSMGLHPIQTPERRADQIAEATYKEPIFYDDETVQSTTMGVRPRPAYLGL